MTAAPGPLVLLRHGESEWNAQNLFTGWVNVPLSAAGQQEAIRAGRLLASHGLRPGFAHTSVQRRAIRTAELALAECDRDWIPVRRSWRSTPTTTARCRAGTRPRCARGRRRPAGPLAAVLRHGTAAAARRTHEYSQFADPRYAAIPPAERPRTESLRDVTARLLPYWYDQIVPDLRTGACVLVASHGNTLRALVKHLERIADADIAGLDIPTGTPLAYQLGPDLRPRPADLVTPLSR